jgi:hypothetical protein
VRTLVIALRHNSDVAALFLGVKKCQTKIPNKPLAMCEKLKMLIANRWWGVENGKRKMH